MNVRFPLIALVLAAGSAARADELADLLKRVPADMNTVAVVNVRAINQTPRAMKENWRQNFETEYLAGAIAVPPWVPVVVVAADLQPGALAHGRSLALIPVDNSVNSENLAKRENGVVQAMGDRTIALSPRRGYMGVPAAGILGISSTMPRQHFAHWYQSAQKPDKPVMPSYLQEAIAAHKDAHVLVAADLRDMIDPTAARLAVQQAGAASGDAALDSRVRVLTSARGLVFTAQIGGPTRATVRVEFGVPMADFLNQFRELWPKAMEQTGFEIPELKTAEAKADGKAVVMTAELSDTSLRRILSLVRSPGDAVASPDGGGNIPDPKDAAGLAASLRYYRAVNQALDDLKAQGGAKGKDYARSAVFFDTYANKIHKLPIQDVDPALVQYGTSAAAKLHAMAGSLRGLKVQLEAYDSYKSTTWAASGGAWFGRWGGVGRDVTVNTNVEELNVKQAEAVAALEPERAKIWGVLEADRSAVRREMLEKHKIDFERYKR
jgi:hypothetical protein